MKALTFVALAALLPCAAVAQSPQCGPREVIVDTLQSRYGETRRVVAMTSEGTLMELWGNDENGSWTVTMTRPGGNTCLVSAGSMFELVDETPASGAAL